MNAKTNTRRHTTVFILLLELEPFSLQKSHYSSQLSHWAIVIFSVLPVMSDPYNVSRAAAWKRSAEPALLSKQVEQLLTRHIVLFAPCITISPKQVEKLLTRHIVLFLNPISYSTTTLVSHPTKLHRWDVRPFIFTESGCWCWLWKRIKSWQSVWHSETRSLWNLKNIDKSGEHFLQ